MRAKRAKWLKRKIYGDNSPRARKYHTDTITRSVIADEYRRIYQHIKKVWTWIGQ